MAATSGKSACLFCKIAAKEDPKTEILYENSNYVAFRDIRPATDGHYLIIPKSHVTDAKSLSVDDSEIVTELIEAGKAVLLKEGIDSVNEEVRMGFHWPPFNFIEHLHLHVLYPVSKMGFLSKLVFRPDSWWFVSPDTVLRYLREKAEKKA